MVVNEFLLEFFTNLGELLHDNHTPPPSTYLRHAHNSRNTLSCWDLLAALKYIETEDNDIQERAKPFVTPKSRNHAEMPSHDCLRTIRYCCGKYTKKVPTRIRTEKPKRAVDWSLRLEQSGVFEMETIVQSLLHDIRHDPR